MDLACFLYGSVSEVSVFLMAPANYAISLRFANGAVGTLSLTDGLPGSVWQWEQVRAIGSEGLCVQVDGSMELLAFKRGTPVAAYKPDYSRGNSNSLVEMGFVTELQAFVDSIRSGESPNAGIASSSHTMAVLEAIEAATQTGTAVSVCR